MKKLALVAMAASLLTIFGTFDAAACGDGSCDGGGKPPAGHVDPKPDPGPKDPPVEPPKEPEPETPAPEPETPRPEIDLGGGEGDGDNPLRCQAIKSADSLRVAPDFVDDLQERVEGLSPSIGLNVNGVPVVVQDHIVVGLDVDNPPSHMVAEIDGDRACVFRYSPPLRLFGG